MKESDKSLPIYNQQSFIEETIRKNPITILTAETGAGKSTRVPLWLWRKGKRVHVTQPRRIAARSLADYLARLTRTHLGEEIGFQTGFESKQSKKTGLLYLTDGVQMIREINGRRSYDVLVVDEVHEWNLNQEVLVGLIKKNLVRGVYKKTNKRVVIMSATLQADRLSRFLGKAPVISVEGRGFPVSMHHNDPRFLLPDTAAMVELGKNVLVFQPGKKEIRDFSDELERMLEGEKVKAKILPLHAELSLKAQADVFKHYKIPKVIVATDIAQTSLTIDDIDGVVDTGIKKELRVVKGIAGLYPTDISEAECMQRAGRAGRVRNGQYILCADAGIKERPPFPDPEIQLVNLDSVILRLIKMGIQPLEFPFFHAPSKALVFKGIKQLKLLGATDEEGRVTEDGKKMAEFPVSLRSARMLMEAQKGNANVIDAAVKCIAILETKGIASKEALGEVYHNAPYRSDLLNQLALWNSHKQYRKSLNWKKFSQAGDIHKELNKRLGLTARVKGGLSTKDMPILYRSLLSCFADEIHFKGGNEYQRDNEVRQLDRSSVLYENKPEMVAGIPFDLVITRENYDTGEKEDAFIPLITFASELTLELLEELKPFSYYKEERITIEKKVVAVFREHYFGGKLISAVSTSPRKQDMEEKKRVVAAVIEWFDHHGADFALAGKMKVLETQFNEASSVVKRKLKPFSTYWRDFLYRELMEHLDIDTLDLFFKFHSGFSIITLKNILPGGVIKELKQAYWPRKIALHDVPPLTRQDAKDDRGTKKPPKQKTSGKEPPVEKKEKGAGDLDKKPPEMPRREGINKARHAGTDKARQEAKDMPRQVAKEISQKVAMDNSQQNTTAPLSVENTLPLKGAPVVTESHYVGRVYYIRRKPFLKFSYSLLEKVKEQHLILPTGEIAGVLLDGRKYFRWQHVENEYNRWKKKNIFDKKYRDLKKDGYMDDLQEIPFPQTFEAGKGLDNKPFEFYTVPTIEQGKVFLVHYFHKEDAESYFEELRPQWETFVRNYKKSKIDNIFKQKGWTVR